jgi:hypothetical protein
VVDVQQRALRALQQQRRAVGESLVQQQPGVRDPRLEPLRIADVLLPDRVHVQRPPVVDLDQDLVALAERGLQLGPERLRVEQVLHPDAHPRDLVPVRGADAAAGGADPGLAQVALGDFVQGPVVRHDQMRVGGDHQPAGVHSPRLQRVQLLDQHRRVDHHTVPDHARHAGSENPRREQVQRIVLTVRSDDRVTGVVSALVADDVLDLLAEQVGRLALALVAPLSTDEHDRGHRDLLGQGPGTAKA